MVETRCPPHDAATCLRGCGYFVINHFDGGSDHLLVMDIDSGDIVCDVDTGATSKRNFLTPGRNNDVLYCSTVSYARIFWD